MKSNPADQSRAWTSVAANFIAQGISILLALIFIPTYLRVLGIEAYGVIGFYVSLQALFYIFDFGLASALNRELARLTELSAGSERQRDLVRTLEWLYWPLGLAIAIVIWSCSGLLAERWLQLVGLDVETTRRTIGLMGLAIALQWPSALYGGGLRGVDRQVTLNILGIGISIVRSVGSVVVLLFISPTLEGFFLWQGVVSALQSLLYRAVLWRELPGSGGRPKFRLSIIRELQSFTLGLTGVAALSFMLSQSDRIVLSRILPLTEFGYYSLAVTVGSVLSSMIGPFFNTFFPRYSTLVAAGAERELVAVYHQSNQFLIVLVASTAAVVCNFSNELLLLWTRDALLAARTAPILRLFVAGTALHGFLHLPYALQLAHGWTRLALVQNLISVIIVVPAIYLLGTRFGGVGAASVWVALNVAWILTGIPTMHSRLLRTEQRKWFFEDLAPPAIAAVCAAVALGQLVTIPENRISGSLTLLFIGVSTLIVSGLAARSVRAAMRMLLISRSFHAWFVSK